MTTPAPLGATPTDLLDDPLLHGVRVLLGHKVLDQIVLLARIGGGGMGIVYRGWHVKFRLDVAVKVLKPALAADAEYVHKFQREAQLSMGITHQNVVRVVDVRCDHDLHYIVMEFIDGETVPARIARWGRMRQREAVTMLVGVAAGLTEAHGRGIVHRDIKPDNLLIARSGRVKLADLGLARVTVTSPGATMDAESSRLMGTPQYMPPEQWKSANVRPAADVWALGATFYYLVTGEHAVPSGKPLEVGQWIHDHDLPSLRDKAPALRRELHDIFECCVQRAEASRFASARELLTALLPLQLHDETLLREEELAAPMAKAPAFPIDPAVLARISEVLSAPVLRPVRRREAPRGERPRGPRWGQLARAAAAAVVLVAVVVFTPWAAWAKRGATAAEEPLAGAATAEPTTGALAAVQTADPQVPIPPPAAAAPVPAAIPAPIGVIKIVSPTNGSQLRRDVALEIDAPGATSVAVTGGNGPAAASPFGDARWRWQGTVTEGQVALRVVGSDAAGKTAEATFTGVSDQTAPTLKLDELPEFTNQDAVRIIGAADGASAILVGDRTFPHTGGPFDLPVPLPRDGALTFSVFARDDAGNTSAARDLTTRRHTVPPEIAWAGPDLAAEHRGDVVVRIAVRSDVGVAEVTVNGKPARERDGEWQATVSTADARETGCTVAATDRAANSNTSVQVLNSRESRLARLAKEFEVLDQEFAAAVRQGKRADIDQVVDRMAKLCPDDPSYLLLKAMVAASLVWNPGGAADGNKTVAEQRARAFRDAMKAGAGPFGPEHVAARLRRLGAEVAAGRTPDETLILGKPANQVFFADHQELEFRIGRLEGDIGKVEKEIETLKAGIEEGRRRQEEYRRKAKSDPSRREGWLGAVATLDREIAQDQQKIDRLTDKTLPGKKSDLDRFQQALRRMRSFELK